MKKVYIVYGNHDGNIGVYTTLKAAYQRAVSYIESGDDEVMTTYEEVKKSNGWVTVYSNGSTDASIQTFYLNK